ncbi:MAG: M50 family metallopeptidase [Actinomycetota bacterium]|jgi:membrane-associated protease RseP (regulator of RpoE activity)|nr:M50 family metallopeptidase [Actinomycetota bacterium]
MGAVTVTADQERAGAGTEAPDPGRSSRRALVELVVVLSALSAVLVLAGAGDVLVFAACVVAMVMLHELGHLLAAKRGGMKVTEYFLGFGPKLWSVRRGETEYGVKALPLGGYVKIPGMTALEEVDPADEERSYRSRPFGARLLVAVAGSAVHMVIAFVLLVVVLVAIGTPRSDQVAIEGFVPLSTGVTPAQRAGLQPGDVVVAADGRPVAGNATLLSSVIRSHPGTPVTLVVERNGVRRTVQVTPVDARSLGEAVSGTGATTNDGAIGVQLGSPLVTVGPLAAVGHSFSELGSVTAASVAGVGHLFSPAGMVSRFDQVVSSKAADAAAANGTRVQSIVGVVQTGGQAVHAGIYPVLVILITINVFFAVFNMLPLLPFDGGHVAIAVYERIRTRRGRPAYHADVAKMMPFTVAVIGFVAVLFATSLAVDLAHPLPNPFG